MTTTKLALAGSALSALFLTACAQETSAQAGDMSREEVETIVREYILENPEIIEDALIVLRDRQQAAEREGTRQAIRDNAEALFSNANDHFIGPADAEVVVVEFFDYRCGYCKRSLDYVAGLPAAHDGNVRVVFKELPILSPESRTAALAALAAGNQGKYFEMHMGLMEASGSFSDTQIDSIARAAGVDVDQMRADMESEAVQSQLAESIALARAIGISGTPAFIVDDMLVPGANTPMVDSLIETALGG